MGKQISGGAVSEVGKIIAIEAGKQIGEDVVKAAVAGAGGQVLR